MSTNTTDPNFVKRCGELWNVMVGHTTLDRFHENIKVREKSVFLGYADLTIGVGQLFSWKVRGVSVKLINGKPHLDMPSERGADGKYYPQTFPKTAETRTVLTTVVFSDARIQAAMENAANQAPVSNDASANDAEIPAEIPAAAPQIANPFAS